MDLPSRLVRDDRLVGTAKVCEVSSSSLSPFIMLFGSLASTAGRESLPTDSDPVIPEINNAWRYLPLPAEREESREPGLSEDGCCRVIGLGVQQPDPGDSVSFSAGSLPL